MARKIIKRQSDKSANGQKKRARRKTSGSELRQKIWAVISTSCVIGRDLTYFQAVKLLPQNPRSAIVTNTAAGRMPVVTD